jgi:hypothetical protein
MPYTIPAIHHTPLIYSYDSPPWVRQYKAVFGHKTDIDNNLAAVLNSQVYTVHTHCTHTLYSHTVLTHCTHTLYSHTVLTHCTRTLYSSRTSLGIFSA